MYKIAVMVSGSGSNLQAIIDQVKGGQIRADLALVLSNREDAYGLERARQNQIPARYIKNDKEALLASLEEHKIDLIVLAGYLAILEEEVIDKYENRILNIHPSLIPKYSGKGYYGVKVHQAVLAAGEKTSGATVHYVDKGIDTGQIILQRQLSIEEGESPESLQKRVLEIEHQLLPEAINIVLKKMEEKDESHT